MNFQEMNLSPEVTKALTEVGIISPTKIQEESILNIMTNEKCHVIGQAKTGSGKTLAFAIPIIEKLNIQSKNVQAVILVPTRELCKQVSSVFNIITKYKKFKTVEIYGGVSINKQTDKIRNGAQIVIATPGRLIDIYKRRQISFKQVKIVVLDEADRMLDMGFIPDIRYILLDAMNHATPSLMLYSATLSEQIKELIQDFTNNERIMEIFVSQDSLTVDNCAQHYYKIHKNKYWSFLKILKYENPDYSIIFTKTKRKSKEIAERLKDEKDHNLNVEFIHGDLSQAKREEIISQFRKRKINCLVGTNVLARGLDFPKVSHVFNYDLPLYAEDYVHRIGRTARISGKDRNCESGKAISLVSNDQKQLLSKIEHLLKKKIEERSVSDFQIVQGDSKPFQANDKKDRGKSYNSKKKKNSKRKRVHEHPKKENRERNFEGSNADQEKYGLKSDNVKKKYTPKRKRVHIHPKKENRERKFEGSNLDQEKHGLKSDSAKKKNISKRKRVHDHPKKENKERKFEGSNLDQEKERSKLANKKRSTNFKKKRVHNHPKKKKASQKIFNKELTIVPSQSF